MKKAIVIQGGGSYGAYTAGRIYKRLVNYDIAVGSSTGALIAPFALLGEYNVLKNCYTNVSNKDIYSKYPFYKNGVPNIQMALWAWIRQKKGITDSKPLRELISKRYTADMHKAIDDLGKELYVTGCVLNAVVDYSMYFKSSAYSHKDFCDLIWASTLVPGLLEPFNKKGNDLVDGGVTENVGLNVLSKRKNLEIDVFLHQVFSSDRYKPQGKNWVHNLTRALVMQRQEVVSNDLNVKMDESSRLNIFYVNSPLVGAGIMEFNKEVMNKWFNQGMEYPS